MIDKISFVDESGIEDVENTFIVEIMRDDIEILGEKLNIVKNKFEKLCVRFIELINNNNNAFENYPVRIDER